MMKQLILAAALPLALGACKKAENTTTTTDSTTDSAAVVAPADITAIPADSATTATSSPDAETVKKFVEGSLMEVKLGNLAKEKATNAKVKELASVMVADHSKTRDELKAIAGKKGWAVPADLGAEKQKKYDEFAAKSGEEFDKAYASFMVEDHKKDIDEHTKASNNAVDADLKAYATKTVPALQHHLKMAEEAVAAVK